MCTLYFSAFCSVSGCLDKCSAFSQSDKLRTVHCSHSDCPLQVGSLAMAEPMLRAMVDTLAPGGLLVITGFTRSFLSPRLIVRAGVLGSAGAQTFQEGL